MGTKSEDKELQKQQKELIKKLKKTSNAIKKYPSDEVNIRRMEEIRLELVELLDQLGKLTAQNEIINFDGTKHS